MNPRTRSLSLLAEHPRAYVVLRNRHTQWGLSLLSYQAAQADWLRVTVVLTTKSATHHDVTIPPENQAPRDAAK